MNTYSPTWYSLFMETIPAAQTEAEVAWLGRHLPLPKFRRVLDLCCGTGRHAARLANRGYAVTGVDRNAAALAEARRAAGAAATFVEGDMRHLDAFPGPWDAVLLLWQSFGYFDAATNREILRGIHGHLRPGGRLVLDIYHRGFFERQQGIRTFERACRTVTEHKWITGDCLTVQLDYGPDEGDTFEWQVWAPEEIGVEMEGLGYRLVQACTGFDEVQPASPEHPRMQMIFTK